MQEEPQAEPPQLELLVLVQGAELKPLQVQQPERELAWEQELAPEPEGPVAAAHHQPLVGAVATCDPEPEVVAGEEEQRERR